MLYLQTVHSPITTHHLHWNHPGPSHDLLCLGYYNSLLASLSAFSYDVFSTQHPVYGHFSAQPILMVSHFIQGKNQRPYNSLQAPTWPSPSNPWSDFLLFSIFFTVLQMSLNSQFPESHEGHFYLRIFALALPLAMKVILWDWQVYAPHFQYSVEQK